MEREPTDQEKEEALDWLLKEKEGKDIKILDSKDEKKSRKSTKKTFKKKIGSFGQKELFKENI